MYVYVAIKTVLNYLVYFFYRTSGNRTLVSRLFFFWNQQNFYSRNISHKEQENNVQGQNDRKRRGGRAGCDGLELEKFMYQHWVYWV